MKILSKIFIFGLLIAAFAAGFLSRYFDDSVVRMEAYAQTANLKTAFFWDEVGEITNKFALIKPTEEYKLAFVGDIMLSRAVGKQIEKYDDPIFPFRLVAEALRAYDFTFGNLENPVSNRGKNQGSIYSFRADPKTLEGLVFAGFDAVSIANNHIFDWGRDALEDTITLLESNNIEPIGAGRNYDEANDLKIIEIGNLKEGVRLALFGYTNLYPSSLKAGEDYAGISDFNKDLIQKRISEIRDSVDIVIVSIHWGEEYETQSNALQQEYARAFIDAGADLIVGHHPHVIQEIEKYIPHHDQARSGYIIYSLGNFVFDQNFSKNTRTGLIAEVIVKDKKIINVLPHEIYINDTFQPELSSD